MKTGVLFVKSNTDIPHHSQPSELCSYSYLAEYALATYLLSTNDVSHPLSNPSILSSFFFFFYQFKDLIFQENKHWVLH